jgi:hypothetical protein
VESLPLIVKIGPRRSLSRTFMPWVFEKLGIRFDRPTGSTARPRSSATRPSASCRSIACSEQVPSLRVALPKCYGLAHDTETGEEAMFLEMIGDIRSIDPAGVSFDWPAADIDAALRAAAGWQAAFWGADERRLAWAGPRPTTADMADAPLWRAIVDHGRARLPQIVTETVCDAVTG